MKQISLLITLLISFWVKGQAPVFGNEIPVTLNGYTLDAMEPFISPDGNALFFNSLNDGNTTSLYYAAKVNDSTFNLIGVVPAVNQSVTPRLDAVASVDTANNFYWVSTRNYPSNFDNLHRVKFLTSSYTNFGRVHGNIYIYSPGWLIMDAAINYSGDKLFYCNAWFNSCSFNMPCKAALDIAQKTNDSTFTKLSNSGSLLSNINDTVNYIIYAPQLSKDELELYYTRALKGVAQTEICVSVRTSTNTAFGPPSIIYPLSSNVPEAATITTDKSRLYYHKNQGGIFKLFLKYRTGTTGLKEELHLPKLVVYPNPNDGIFTIDVPGFRRAVLFTSLGCQITVSNDKILDIRGLPDGSYFLKVETEAGVLAKKIILYRP